MEEPTKSYYAIIPANVRYDKSLTPNAKLLYGEITALCNEKGYCWATNDYFANLYGVSKTSISKWISTLVTKGYLKMTIEYREGSKEILNRYLRIVNYPIEEKLNTSIEEKLNTPIEEKLKDNNTLFNNTLLNNTMNNTLYNFNNNLENKNTNIILNENNISSESINSDASDIINAYNDICVDLPKVQNITDGRKRKLKTRLKTFSSGDIIKAFEKAQSSDFISRGNRKWCNFDWIVDSDEHITKILEGVYDNNKSKSNQSKKAGVSEPAPYSDEWWEQQ